MQDKTGPRRKGRMFKWVLGLSLALNLLVIGAFAGAALRHAGDRGPDRKGPPGIQDYGAPFVRALPRDARHAFFRELHRRSGGVPSRAERRETYDRMADLLRQDPFDPGAVRALLVQQQVAAQGVQDQAQEAWLTLITQMTAAERETVAQRLQERLRKGRHRDKKGP